jgi:hypothetical protein
MRKHQLIFSTIILFPLLSISQWSHNPSVNTRVADTTGWPYRRDHNKRPGVAAENLLMEGQMGSLVNEILIIVLLRILNK